MGIHLLFQVSRDVSVSTQPGRVNIFDIGENFRQQGQYCLTAHNDRAR